MSTDNENTERLEQAKALVKALEAGDNSQADEILKALGATSESDLFLEVGRLTRELHEAINGFLLDARISDMTQVEIPDAKERLNYVITMTQQSADRTLTAVEQSLPLVDGLSAKAAQLSQEWKKFTTRQLDKQDYLLLSDELDGFFDQTTEEMAVLHSNLSEVLMAQDFQDLTGQIIRKVIDLVHDVEEKLVMLVKITGGKMGGKEPVHADPNVLEGPAVPGVVQGDQVTNQDDVDDLLSSLGF